MAGSKYFILSLFVLIIGFSAVGQDSLQTDTLVADSNTTPTVVVDSVPALDTLVADSMAAPNAIALDPLQPEDRYDSDRLTPAFHKGRRAALREVMPDSSVALFFANPLRNRTGDINHKFHQEPNLYYLSGYVEPHAMLMVFKDSILLDSIYTNEILFVQPKSEREEMWTGRRLGVEGSEKLGIRTVMANKEFADLYLDFSNLKVFYLGPKNDVRDNPNDRGDLFSMLRHFRNKVADHPHVTEGRLLLDIMAGIRQYKQPEELVLMQKAIDYTCQGLQELMTAMYPGITEYQSEALVEFVFKREGAEAVGFPSIMAGGENACIMHYTTNRRRLGRGDLLVADVGAEYHGYPADVTRTIPVEGSFTEEQAIIYNIVLEAQEAAIAAAKVGNRFWAPHVAARNVIGKRLRQHGIITSWVQIGTYFMHGTSHYLGLEVHDAGLYGPLKPNQVITVEPGIYIPEGSKCDPKWWNIGVRIEDDLLITKEGPQVLSDCVPRTIEEIEAMMEETSRLMPPPGDRLRVDQ